MLPVTDLALDVMDPLSSPLECTWSPCDSGHSQHLASAGATPTGLGVGRQPLVADVAAIDLATPIVWTRMNFVGLMVPGDADVLPRPHTAALGSPTDGPTTRAKDELSSTRMGLSPTDDAYLYRLPCGRVGTPSAWTISGDGSPG